MKKILGFVILLGFVIMLGAAGSADVSDISFGKVLILELSGMAVSFLGMVALCQYKRYLRCRRRSEKHGAIAKRVGAVERELA